LGTETLAAAIEIRWPSGIRQTLKNVRADQILQVDEPSGSTGERKPPAR
jgi:enediyne biosynthesis protein E4